MEPGLAVWKESVLISVLSPGSENHIGFPEPGAIICGIALAIFFLMGEVCFCSRLTPGYVRRDHSSGKCSRDQPYASARDQTWDGCTGH